MGEKADHDQDSLSASQPISEDLFVENIPSNEDSDDSDSAHSSDQDCFRPSTPMDEIEREENDEKKRQIELKNSPISGERTNPNPENKPQYKKAVQPSTCCILI